MKLVKSLAGALLVSAWLLIHALFIVNANLLLQSRKSDIKDVKQLVPLHLPSIFHLSWFHKLLRHAFSLEQLEMPRGVCGDYCVVYFSWIVSALTLAEWATFTFLVVSALWHKVIRPLVSTIAIILLAAALYGIARSCAFMLTPHLPEDAAVAVVRLLVAIDGVLLRLWQPCGAVCSWLLWVLDGALGSLVWPTLEQLKDDAAHPHHRSLLTELLTKVQEVTSRLPQMPDKEL